MNSKIKSKLKKGHVEELNRIKCSKHCLFVCFRVKLRFLKNSPLNIKLSHIFRLSPLCMNEKELEKVLGCKIGITSYS